MARRIVDYIFKVSRDDVGPRFKSLAVSQRGFTRRGKRAWASYERDAIRSMSNIARGGKREFNKLSKVQRKSLVGRLGLLATAAATVVAVKKSIVSVASLESQILGLATKLDTPLESLKNLRREIEDFSTTKGIKQSADDLGLLLNNAVGFGLDLKPALKLVKEISRAASATHSNPNTLLGAFLIASGARPELLKDPKTAIGKLLVASDIGGIEIEDSAPALGATTAPAKKAKISFEEQLALISALSTSGIDKPQVGTAIAQMLSLITRTAFRKGARRLGINVIDGKGQLKSAIEIINLVGQKFRKLESQPKQQKVLDLLFGVGNVRAERGFVPFFDEVEKLKGGVKTINKRGPLQVDKSFAERLKELATSLDRLSNTIDFITRDFGQIFRGSTEIVSDVVAGVLPKKGEKTPSERILEGTGRAPESFSFAPGGKSLLGLVNDFFSQKSKDVIRNFLRSSSLKRNVPQVSFLDSGSSSKKGLLNSAIVVKPTIQFNPKININQNIDPLTGETKTRVTVDQTDLARRLPTGPTP